jgi:hypothetical protein
MVRIHFPPAGSQMRTWFSRNPGVSLLLAKRRGGGARRRAISPMCARPHRCGREPGFCSSRSPRRGDDPARAWRRPEPVEAFVLNTKRYAVFDGDSVTVADGKESVLGALLSPIDLNPHAEENSVSKAWIKTHAWPAMRANWEHGAPFPAWADHPAVRRMSVSNPRFLKHNLNRMLRDADGRMLPKASQIRPFNVFIVSTCKIDGKDIAVVAPYERAPSKWRPRMGADRQRRDPHRRTRYIITKQHLDLSHRPDRPFQNDEAVAVPIDDRIGEWHRVAVPAIRALGSSRLPAVSA